MAPFQRSRPSPTRAVAFGGAFALPHPPADLWPRRDDPDLWRAAVPGLEHVRRLPDGRFQAALRLADGPFAGHYVGTLRVEDVTPAKAFEVRMQGGGRGRVTAVLAVQLAPENGGTAVRYRLEMDVAGETAAAGPRLLESNARAFIRRAAEYLRGPL